MLSHGSVAAGTNGRRSPSLEKHMDPKNAGAKQLAEGTSEGLEIEGPTASAFALQT
jgi:hypothetical protein